MPIRKPPVAALQPDYDSSRPIWVTAVVEQIVARLRETISLPHVQPVLLNVKDAAIYLGRSEQSIQHLIFQREIPVVRIGRRVHLDRRDLDAWIEKNKY